MLESNTQNKTTGISTNNRPLEDALRARIAELEAELVDERAGRPLLAKATDMINDLQARVARLEEALRKINDLGDKQSVCQSFVDMTVHAVDIHDIARAVMNGNHDRQDDNRNYGGGNAQVP